MDLKSLHKKCFRNEYDIQKSKLCGCFYCLSIFAPSEITDWIDEGPINNQETSKTAECPRCGIDSVLPDNIGYELNKELLEIMRNKYF